MKRVLITADCKTMHGNFYAGEIRMVEANVAGLLIGNGWATETISHTLEVDSVSTAVNSQEPA